MGESKPEQSGQEKAGQEGQDYIKGPEGIAFGGPPGGNDWQQAGQGKAGEEGQEGTTVDKTNIFITMQHQKESPAK